MSTDVKIEDVKATIREIVFEAPDLSALTRRRVKQDLAERLGVKAAVFDAPSYKLVLKDIITDAVTDCQEERGGHVAGTPSASQKSTNSPRRKTLSPRKNRSPAKPQVVSDDEADVKPSSSSKRDASSTVASSDRPGSSQKKRKELDMSDMSELDDDEEKPKKKRKRQSSPGSSAKRGGEGKKRASRKTGDGPDAEVKRLQSYVTACGVRKRWKNLFEDGNCSGDSSIDYARQAKIVRGVLEELGMTGRLSMDRAKKIKEQREMEEELAEIGLSVAAPAGKLRSGKRVTRGAVVDSSEPEEYEGEESEDEGPAARKPKFSSDLAAFADELNSD